MYGDLHILYTLSPDYASFVKYHITQCAYSFIESNSTHTGVLTLSLLRAAEGERLSSSKDWVQTE